jgi:ArsR family transcriptional regulator, virulence genes transcriptional regulator
MKYQVLFARQAALLRVLASPKRLELVQLLRNRQLNVTAMVEMLGLRQANVSQHLAILRQAGVVTTRREGVTIYYSLTDQRIARACALLKRFLQHRYRDDPALAAILGLDERTLFPAVTDPVCGMRFSIAEAGGSALYQGTRYYFCAAGCQQRFTAHPTRFVRKVRAG